MPYIANFARRCQIDHQRYSDKKDLIEGIVNKPIDEYIEKDNNDYYSSSSSNNSYNLGSIDYYSLIKNDFKEIKKNKQGKYFLYRVGDAISSRNIHSAIYDSLRICKNL